MTVRRFRLDPVPNPMVPNPIVDDGTSVEPAAAPRNRAERRGKASSSVPDQASRLPATGHARPAQGRRVNPVRRTG